MKTQLLSIDAWRDPDGGWTWNQWFNVQDPVNLPDNVTTRQLLKLCRDELGILSDWSKGRVLVDDDGTNLVICDRGTREPLFAFEYAGKYWEENEL